MNLSTRLSSRVGAWLVLVVGLLLAVGILGTLRGSTPPAANRAAPSTSESARVDTQLAALPGHDVQNVLLVATRTDGQALSSIHRWAFGCQRDVVCALRFVWGRG